MTLTKKQLAARDGKLTASRVACLMSGDKDKILNLWRELVGDPAFVPEDLSGNWPVQLGALTESLNLDWYERKYGKVTRRGEVVVPTLDDWMACTLDGWDYEKRCPIETKHTGGFEKLEVIIERYQPQMHWQMSVTGTTQCALSVIMGAREPIVEMIEYNLEYGIELLGRAKAFMAHVKNRTPPVILPAVAPPVIPVREVDMQGNNQWASAAAQWLENRRAAKEFEDAQKNLKEVMPPDAVRAYGHKVEIKRDKAGRLKIGEQ